MNIFCIKLVGFQEFGSQDRRSVFPVVFWRGDESKSREFIKSTLLSLTKLKMENYLLSCLNPVSKTYANITNPNGSFE